jgi:hypothetical protein
VELIHVLRSLYALAQLNKGAWHAKLRNLGEKSMDNGVYCELFRMIIYDRDLTSQEASLMIAETIQEIDPDVSIPDPDECDFLYIQYTMNQILEEGADVLKIAHELIVNEYNIQISDSVDYEFHGLGELMNEYYSWWAGYSEWMVGNEREAQRLQSISDIKSAARKWLSKNSAY